MTDETPLIADLDLGDALVAVETSGAAFLPRVLTPTFCQLLQAQLERAPFEKLPDQIGPVRQEADLFVTRGAMTDLPAVAKLRHSFVRHLRHGPATLSNIAEWWPNEAYVQRYAPGSLGVSPHVDSSRFGKRWVTLLASSGRPGAVVNTRPRSCWSTAPVVSTSCTVKPGRPGR